VLVVPGDARADGVLAGLRVRGVERVDLVVLRSPGPAAAGVLSVVRQRVAVGSAWAPEGSPAADATTAPTAPMVAGGLRVACTPEGERLAVVVELVGPTGAPGSAVGPDG
jgi:hypothetical protein